MKKGIVRYIFASAGLALLSAAAPAQASVVPGEADRVAALVQALTAPAGPAAFPLIAAGGADPRYPVKPKPCRRPIAPLEIEGQTISCGTVSVPVDHGRPGGPRIDLEFIIYRARSLVPAPDAVVHLHGGPGGGIVENVALTSVYFEKLRARRDIVAFDQRGVDASGASTRCLKTVAENLEPVAASLAGRKVPVDFPEASLKACIAEIKAAGLDIRFINTEQNARDVQAVMRALGYPTFNVYGISYGTKLGLEVMRTAPEGVRAVVLDSVAPPHIATYDTLLTPHAEALGNTFRACAADPQCAAAYPDLERRFLAMIDTLNAKPLQSLQGPINGEILFGIIDMRNDYTRPRGLTAYVPKLIAELEKGETKTLAGILEGAIPPKLDAKAVLAGAKGLSPDEAALAQLALQSATQADAAQQSATLALRQLEADRAQARNPAMVGALFDAELGRAVRQLGGKDAVVAFGRDYLALRAAPPSAAALEQLVTRHFSGDVGDRLLAQIRLMGDADVAEVIRRANADNSVLDKKLTGDLELMLYACQEDMDINSIEGARRVNAGLNMPAGLKKDVEKTLTALYGKCALFGKQPRAGFHDPVTSPIPALVFSGTLDTQTATSWGPETARHLANGRSVVFPETGHGALAFSACAQDIGVAFIENPTAPIDTGCTKALQPRFVLPDGTLSAGPAAAEGVRPKT